MNYSFKYTSGMIFKVAGVLWFFVGIVHAGIFLLFASSMELALLIFLVASILSLRLGIFYFRIEYREYVKITSEELIVDRGLAWPSKVVSLDDIKIVRPVGNTIRFGLNDNEELRVRTGSLTVTDIDKLIEVVRGRNNMDN